MKTSIRATGETYDIQEAKERLRILGEEGTEVYISEEKEGLYFVGEFTGKWRDKPPDMAKEIFKAFTLSGDLVQESEEENRFIKKVFVDGKCENTIEGNFFCPESVRTHGEDFWLDLYGKILRGSSKEREKILSIFFEAGIDREEVIKKTTKVKKEIVFIVGNSGTGKTELAKDMNRVGYNIVKSFTSRTPREGSDDDTWYQFMDKEEMRQRGESFIEMEEFGGELYATSVQAFDLSNPSVKIIGARGLADTLVALRDNNVEVTPVVVLMDIAKTVVREVLEKEGWSRAEMEKRIGRDDPIGSAEILSSYKIKPDIVVRELDKNTSRNVLRQVGEVLKEKNQKVQTAPTKPTQKKYFTPSV